jgi:hypothetical protein
MQLNGFYRTSNQRIGVMQKIEHRGIGLLAAVG